MYKYPIINFPSVNSEEYREYSLIMLCGFLSNKSILNYF